MVSLPPGSRLGRYQMVEGIGRGGDGERIQGA